MTVAKSPESPGETPFFFDQEPQEWLPSPAEVVERCAALRTSSPATDGEGGDALTQLFESMGAPALDLLVTPLSSQVGRMAADQGQVFFHHELRGRLPVPESLAPERQVWEKGAVPVWENGILTEPKYFSFFLDGQIAPYNPNYRRKWRAHELLHGCVGFFWHPEMTRFACYLGARLDELLPVIHWHFLDEVFRPRCPKHRHQRSQMFRELCPDCEAEAIDFRLQPSPDASAIDHGRWWVAQGWEHMATEWDACGRELHGSRRVSTRLGPLDASSDAMGYLYSHWSRLTAWSFGAWVELFLVDGIDYHSTIPAMMERIAHVTRDLVMAQIPLSDGSPLLRARRGLIDLAYRALLVLEWFEEGSRKALRAEDAMMPAIERAAELCHELLAAHQLQPQQDTHTHLQKAQRCTQELMETATSIAASSPSLPQSLRDALPMHGFCWRGAEALIGGTREGLMEPSIPLLQRGLATAVPQAFEHAGISIDQLQLTPFLAANEFLQSGHLLQRFQQWTQQRQELPAALQQWLAFEAWLYAAPTTDEEADCFSVLLEDIGEIASMPGELRLHQTFRMKAWPGAFVNQVLGDALVDAHEPEAWLAAIHHDGAPQLMLVDDNALQVLQGCLEESPHAAVLCNRHTDAPQQLMEHGFLVWLPQPIGLENPGFGRAALSAGIDSGDL